MCLLLKIRVLRMEKRAFKASLLTLMRSDQVSRRSIVRPKYLTDWEVDILSRDTLRHGGRRRVNVGWSDLD